MDKKEFRESLYSDPLEPQRMTPTEAFEAGKRGDLTAYDSASRKIARVILEWAEKDSGNKQTFFERYDNPKYPNLKAGGVELDDIPEIKKVVDEVGPTGFMYSWAVESINWLLRG